MTAPDAARKRKEKSTSFNHRSNNTANVGGVDGPKITAISTLDIAKASTAKNGSLSFGIN